jgi:hypothetical protein
LEQPNQKAAELWVPLALHLRAEKMRSARAMMQNLFCGSDSGAAMSGKPKPAAH